MIRAKVYTKDEIGHKKIELSEKEFIETFNFSLEQINYLLKNREIIISDNEIFQVLRSKDVTSSLRNIRDFLINQEKFKE
ncbi:hypothetical protein NPA08_01960 [Mycoplasmopsis citelli]|uniref:hypothetical protein n=1 Tax=Mycoplasmopsis citelli TaxID=171281 RepID=UPI002113C54D|nr:hypothetical protein [Mycoplasmopsis citelli]UUD36576.1 hypothetical protein NPA08_01960 [Mycoplasmopsis citelli]